MTKYREILRLHSMNLSQVNIAASCGVSKKTVNKVLKAARDHSISWPIDDAMTDAALEERLFSKAPKVSPTKQMPDFNYIRKELLKNGVNKKLLRTEYLETCRQSGANPLMYSQFCYYIQKDHDSGWYDQLGGDDRPLAEAILDKIKHDAYKINIIPVDPENYRSMREVYGLDKSISE